MVPAVGADEIEYRSQVLAKRRERLAKANVFEDRHSSSSKDEYIFLVVDDGMTKAEIDRRVHAYEMAYPRAVIIYDRSSNVRQFMRVRVHRGQDICSDMRMPDNGSASCPINIDTL
jgi:hypothetical protein